MTQHHAQYEIDDRPERINLERVHAWLSGTYWSPGIARETVEQAAANSALVVGAYDGPAQVAFLRIISDRTTFAWIADVYVDDAHRGQGLARAMVQFCLSHPDYQGLRRWMLATADAHGVYEGVGFHAPRKPESLMEHRPVKPAA